MIEKLIAGFLSFILFIVIGGFFFGIFLGIVYLISEGNFIGAILLALVVAVLFGGKRR